MGCIFCKMSLASGGGGAALLTYLYGPHFLFVVISHTQYLS